MKGRPGANWSSGNASDRCVMDRLSSRVTAPTGNISQRLSRSGVQ